MKEQAQQTRSGQQEWLTLTTVLGLDDPFHHVPSTLQHCFQSEGVSQDLQAESKATTRRAGEIKTEIAGWRIAFQLFRLPLILSAVFLLVFSLWSFSDILRSRALENRHRNEVTEGSNSPNQPFVGAKEGLLHPPFRISPSLEGNCNHSCHF